MFDFFIHFRVQDFSNSIREGLMNFAKNVYKVHCECLVFVKHELKRVFKYLRVEI
mgnify:CR=1 FL=1